MSFGASMLDLIASCWDDENYFNSILSTVLEPLGEANSTICSGLNIDFTNPWGFRIVFEKDTSCSWNEEKSKWEGLSNNEMYLQYPCKPEEELSGAQALARYNSTGPAFPLTCF